MTEVTGLEEVLLLVTVPLVAGILILLTKEWALRGALIRISAALITTVSIYTAIRYFKNGLVLNMESPLINQGMLAVEIVISLILAVWAYKTKKYGVILLEVIQVPVLCWYELTQAHAVHVEASVVIDRLALVMILITGIVGSLICVYAASYMKEYHHHHKELKDKSARFIALLFIFLSAMFGLLMSNNLLWLYFFWEMTTVCSFLLIGYTGSKTALNNAFKALLLNLVGGAGFAYAILYIGFKLNTLEFSSFLKMGGTSASILLPVLLLSLAGLTKSAQMPFSGWLLGAMVAPTPSSALLHSSTMVKAGVFLILRLSPLLHGNPTGVMVSLVGGITFLAASLMAITPSDGKKVLAYSTIANLGLIVACGGIGTYESMWAGILLVIFHAVSKSLLFLSVGTVEHKLGSRDIEDMHGLIIKLPEVALMMTVGIAGMFLAPFGVLVSKWAALKSFIDSDNLLIVLLLVFGSAATLFYWTKWMGKIVAVLNKGEKVSSGLTTDEWISLGSHSVLTVLLCFMFPLITTSLVEPYLEGLFGLQNLTIIGPGDVKIILLMMGLVVLVPVGLYFFVHRKGEKIVSSYMSGINTGDNRHFVDSFGSAKQAYLANWYMESLFSEKKITMSAGIVSGATMALMFILVLGGVL